MDRFADELERLHVATIDDARTSIGAPG
jgi:hypothetical protein